MQLESYHARGTWAFLAAWSQPWGPLKTLSSRRRENVNHPFSEGSVDIVAPTMSTFSFLEPGNRLPCMAKKTSHR